MNFFHFSIFLIIHIWYNLLQSTQLLLLSIQCLHNKSWEELMGRAEPALARATCKVSTPAGSVLEDRPPIQDEA